MNLLIPATVIDIGANKGEWSKKHYTFAPHAKYHLIEPLGIHHDTLKDLTKTFNHAEVHMALLGSEDNKVVPFYVVNTPEAPGSSIYEETTLFPKIKTMRTMNRLDTIIDSTSIEKPLTVKIDVQGAELEVLKGAPKILALTDMLFIELSLIEYNKGAPLAHEVIAYLAAHDFVLYDWEDNFRRVDGVLAQVDATFVRKDSMLRAPSSFWGETVS